MTARLPRRLRLAPALKSVLANSGWLLFDRVLRICLSITVGAWVARHLGPERYGELAYPLALLALFQAACSLGLDGPVVRDVAQSPKRAAAVLGSALRLRLVSGALGWATMLALVSLLRPGDHMALLLVAIVGASLVFQPAEVVDLWLQSQGRSSVSIPLRSATYLLLACVKVALILLNAPLWTFAAAATADVFLVALALILAYRKLPVGTAWKWDPVAARRMCIESWPLMVSALSIGIYMRIDQLMLRQLADERALGLYSAVLPFSQGWQVLPMTLYASLLPRLAQLHNSDRAQYEHRLQQVFAAFLWGGIIVATFTALAAPWLVQALLGPRYRDAVPVLQLHVFTNVFIFLAVAQSFAIVNDRTPRLALYKTLVGAAVAVIANLLLVPRWGAIGAAAAALTAQGFAAVLSNAVFAPATLRMQLRAIVPFVGRRQ